MQVKKLLEWVVQPTVIHKRQTKYIRVVKRVSTRSRFPLKVTLEPVRSGVSKNEVWEINVTENKLLKKANEAVLQLFDDVEGKYKIKKRM